MAQIRLNKVLRELNISIDRAVDFLESKSIEIEKSPNTKISDEVYQILHDEFQTDADKKMASLEVSEAKHKEKEELRELRERELEEKARKEEESKRIIKAKAELSGPKTIGKIDLNPPKPEPKKEEPKKEEPKIVEPKKEEPKTVEPVKEEPKEEVKPIAQKPKEKELTKPVKPEPETVAEDEVIETKYQKLTGPRIAGDKIDLSKFNKPKKKKEDKKKEDKKLDAKKPQSSTEAHKKKRRRISKTDSGGDRPSFSNRGGNNQKGGYTFFQRAGSHDNRDRPVSLPIWLSSRFHFYQSS